VVAQQRVRDFLRDINRAYGTTILLTSHYMDDIEALCSRVVVIDQGRLRYDGSLAALVEQAAPHKVLSLRFAAPIDQAALALALNGAALRPADDPRHVSLAVPREQIAETTSRLLRLGQVVDVGIAEAPIEDVIRELFQSTAAERSAR
jgi:ABC-2 type transport system ATP-binding protein